MYNEHPRYLAIVGCKLWIQKFLVLNYFVRCFLSKKIYLKKKKNFKTFHPNYWNKQPIKKGEGRHFHSQKVLKFLNFNLNFLSKPWKQTTTWEVELEDEKFSTSNTHIEGGHWNSKLEAAPKLEVKRSFWLRTSYEGEEPQLASLETTE